MTIDNDDGAEIKIFVERCWVNPELRGNQFVLEES
jgi:hypothetical protein